MPGVASAFIQADTVVGSKPEVALVVFDDGVYLVVDQRLPVAYRMFYPGIFGIVVVADGNAYGVIGCCSSM